MMLRRGLGLAAASVGVLLAVTGCTRGDPAPTTTTTISGASPTTTSVALPPPSLPAAAKAPTAKSAAEFFRYFIELHNYGYGTLDNQPLLAVSTPECDFCKGAAENISRGAANGYRNIGGQLTVTTAIAAPGTPSKGLIVNAVVDQAAGHTEDSEKKTISSIPPRSNVRIDARVVWANSQWQVVAVRVPTAAEQ